MITLGQFVATERGYSGRVRTLSLDREVELQSTPSDNEKAPSHRAVSGNVDCGAAWAAADAGAVLNVKLDDPAWPEPVRCRLVHGAGDDYLLIWRRPPSD